jgi:hypothetical protein
MSFQIQCFEEHQTSRSRRSQRLTWQPTFPWQSATRCIQQCSSCLLDLPPPKATAQSFFFLLDFRYSEVVPSITMLLRTSNRQNSAEPKIILAANFSLAEREKLNPVVSSMSPGSSSPKGYRSIFNLDLDLSCLPNLYAINTFLRGACVKSSFSNHVGTTKAKS